MSLRTLRFHALQRRVGVFGTDDLLAAVLQAQGIQLTRRMVARYREDINIPSTNQRRKRDWKSRDEGSPAPPPCPNDTLCRPPSPRCRRPFLEFHSSAEVLRGFRIGPSDTIYAALLTGA